MIGAIVVVGVPHDVLLPPVAEGDLQNTDTTSVVAKTMTGIRGNPEFIAGARMMNDVVDLDDRAVVKGDPEFSPFSMGLKAQPLASFDGHERNGDLAVVRIL